MNINISDEISGAERRRALELYPIIYALRKFKGNLKQTAEFLGISKRCLYDRMQSHEELQPLVQTHEKRRYTEPELEKIKKPDWQNQEEKDPVYKMYRYHLNRSIKSFMWNQMNEDQRKQLIARIRNLYYGIS